MDTILLTNGQLRKTLAATRSLGSKGLRVIISEETRCNPSAFSRHAGKALVNPSPKEHPELYLEWLKKTLRDYQCNILFPMDDDTLAVIMKNLDELREYCRIPVPPMESYLITCDKLNMAAYAKSIGVKTPATYIVKDLGELDALSDRLEYPVMIKPGKGNGARGIRKACNKSEFLQYYGEIHTVQPFPIVQEYIPDGDMYDVGLLYNENSELRGSFIMKHVRKFPLDKGPSTVQLGVEHPEMMQMALQFMSGLKWYGMADLEFMVSRSTGQVYFIEINPRFWNSVQVGISSGVDFPWLLYKIVSDGDVEPVLRYKAGLLCRNMLPNDILHFIFNKERSKMNPPFLAFKNYDLNDDILMKDDPGPFWGFVLACLRYLPSIKMWKFLIKR